MATKEKTEVVKDGDIVEIEYEGKLEDGTIFDSSEMHGQTFKFKAGAGNVIRGLDEAVIGMKKGESKTFKVKPEDAYGEHDPQLVQKFPRSQVPKDMQPKVNMMVVLTLQTGEHIPAKIIEVTEDYITLDFNHPLAGKTLIFKIKVISITAKGTLDEK
ncbi:MAG: peptidylprolyl isomerase [Candidatus Aenigmatarchaeota archaeon]